MAYGAFLQFSQIAETFEQNEPRHEKTGFLHMRKKKTQISFFIFATRIVQSLYFLNPKFKSLAIFSNCLARFVSDLVKKKKRKQVFSERGSNAFTEILGILFDTLSLCRIIYGECHEKTCLFGFPTRADTNQAVQSQKMLIGSKFWI